MPPVIRGSGQGLNDARAASRGGDERCRLIGYLMRQQGLHGVS
jgi:hypothetical protein